MEVQLQHAYGRVWAAKMRTLRRQLKGTREDVRLRFLEEEVNGSEPVAVGYKLKAVSTAALAKEMEV